MPTTPTQIRIDNEIKKEATILFKNPGSDMSGAVNLFLPMYTQRRTAF